MCLAPISFIKIFFKELVVTACSAWHFYSYILQCSCHYLLVVGAFFIRHHDLVFLGASLQLKADARWTVKAKKVTLWMAVRH